MRKKSTRKRGSRFRTFRLVLLGGVLLTVGLIFLVFVFGNQEVGPVHKLLFETAGPVQKAMSRATGSIQSLKKEYLGLLSVREDKDHLWQELQECRAAAYKSREAVATNARLRKLLDFKESSGLPTVAAQVIGKDPSLWFRSVIIDRGSSDGVVKGMPVVTGDGIVGQIYSTSPNYAKVLLSIAPSSALDVLLQGSRVRGILKGTGQNTYRLEYILKTVEISEGDHVVTAGYGGLFPTGLPVGVVSRVIKKRRGMFLEIEVTPAVDFETLEGLLVIEQERPSVE
ncbi:MAG: rod shape-determining protein MreC [Deltaproteobacteria bacterium]|nr:rod shape-determining protein MreC [Deltaproteobacteria bacterium]